MTNKDVQLTEEQVVEFYGEKELRWCQVAAKNATISAIADGIRRILICLPTGCGKTLTVASLLDCPTIHTALDIKEDRPLRVLFIAHIHRLLTQAESTFANSNNTNIQIATPFKTISQDKIDWADIIVIDEAHHEAMMSIQLQLDRLSHIPIIGLTATYERSDGMLIKFEKIIEPISREQAVKEGYLAETSIWSFVDTSGRDKINICKSIITNYIDKMKGTMCFMATRREASEIGRFVNSLGYKCVTLINQTPQQIDDILEQFSRGEIDWIVNCSKIGEGIDVKGATSLLLGRQLNSYPMLNQNIGRVARPDSDCQVFELINPLSGTNLDTTVVVGTPKTHVLCSPNGKGGFIEREFDYTYDKLDHSNFVKKISSH